MRRLLPALLAALVLTGCATGTDAVATGGDFEFVAPGGQTRIRYEPAKRQKSPVLSGDNLLEEGKTIKTSDYPGKVVVLNLWGSWCPPCRDEVDDLERVFEQTKDSGVQFLGIDLRDEIRSAAADFVRDHKQTYPSIYDPPGRSLLGLRGYPRNAVPSTILLDRQHRVAAVFLSKLTDSELLPVVQELAAEKS
ncbi:TlpA disulfide reductase family protein [Crossiella sp. CA-258035]|uniref:TlpA disulfide reductase family protein n=1 Tax=Crossiella sp. CA-258035 TaxID=2981138 RepID=UPI0024BCFCED|nr:TlpA disulfide reductase family protein [Crossiella sp. CA-258035]WHT19035.1 TlpA disulfide reductase family protein [Crossiella sp. CA-258035]